MRNRKKQEQNELEEQELILDVKTFNMTIISDKNLTIKKYKNKKFLKKK